MSIPNEEQQMQQIKHAIIDLLHDGKEVTHEILTQTTGLSLERIEHYSEDIASMLSKLKKMRTPHHS